MNDAVQKTRSEINLIREYCARLIADVVTGKLDVRGLAVPEGDGLSGEGERREEGGRLEGGGRLGEPSLPGDVAHLEDER